MRGGITEGGCRSGWNNGEDPLPKRLVAAHGSLIGIIGPTSLMAEGELPFWQVGSICQKYAAWAGGVQFNVSSEIARRRPAVAKSNN